MATELQSLLERIQKEGVDKANAESARLLAAAQDKAAATTRAAEQRAAEMIAAAKKESEAFSERARKALEQAARDVVLSVGESMNRALDALVRAEVDRAIDGDLLRQMLLKVVDSYCRRAGGEARIDVLLSPQEQQAASDFLMARFGEELRRGMGIKGDGSVVKGFRVSVVKDAVEHDFTGDAIAQALCQILRPRLAEIVRKAMSSGS